MECTCSIPIIFIFRKIRQHHVVWSFAYHRGCVKINRLLYGQSSGFSQPLVSFKDVLFVSLTGLVALS